MQHFCFCSHFSRAELKDLKLFLYTQKIHFSQILFTNLSKSVNERFSFAEITHPTSQVWHIKMIRQHDYCTGALGWPQYKATLKCVVLLYWGGPGGQKTGQYLPQPHLPHYLHIHLLRIEWIRLLIVACGMLVHSSSMAVPNCWILAGTGTSSRIRVVNCTFQSGLLLWPA